MAKLGGREMTDEVLLDLVERFGLRVQKTWSSDLSETSILEAESPLLLYSSGHCDIQNILHA